MPKKKTTYTITEAAKKLGLTRAGVHRAIKRGEIAAKWTMFSQVVKRRVLLIAEKDLDGFHVDEAQQERGKKT
jgi:hypothetical protein